jgi:UDP-3-O-[3-hydroxymyristoyl] glucosamine N-acyltransferase
MKLTVAEIAAKLGGTVEGNAAAEITTLAGVGEAGPGAITFLSNPRYAPALATTRAAAVVVDEGWRGVCPCAVIRVKNADQAFAAVGALFAPAVPPPAPGVHPTAVIAGDAVLGAGVSVGPHCVLEAGVRVGDRTVLVADVYLGYRTQVGCDGTLHPHVSTREFTRIGDRVIVHDGAVIGSDGFGYTPDHGAWRKIPQTGIVEIGDDVEIGANVTIDRARFGKTVIGAGVKIDNLVQIAHNVQIGEHTAIAAQVGIAGSSAVGRHVQIGGQAGITGHVAVGDDSVVAGRAGVIKDVPPQSFVSGFPAMPHDKARTIHGHLMNLPQLRQRVEAVEKALEDMRKKEPRESG